MTATAAATGQRRRSTRPRDEFDPTPWPLALLCGAAGGVCALLAFPPYDLWMLLPVAITLLGAGLLVRSAGLALLVSLLWGLALFVPLTHWAGTYAGAMPWVALGVFEALYIVLFGLLARTVMVRRGLCLSSALIVSALWVGVETLRSTAPWGGLPWGASAFALADSPLLNLAPWIGIAGLGFAVALLGQLLLFGALAVLGRRRRGFTGFSGVWPFAIAVAAVLATVVVPHPLNRAPVERPSMTVAGIQGSMGAIDPVSFTMPDDVFANHLAVTRDVIERTASNGTQLDLIVWPEDSTGWDPREDPDLAALDQGQDQVGILICFEIAYDSLVHDVVDDGAEVIVVQSNNALFGDTHEAVQQLAQAKVMAVTSGRSVVHVSTVGHSAIFSPEGRRIDFVDHWEQGALLADVPLRTGITPAVAAGPWISVGLSALGVLGLLAALGTGRRALARPARRRRGD